MIASNSKSRRPGKSKHFWSRSRFLIKLTISAPSETLSVKIFVLSLLNNKLKFTRKSGYTKKKWSTFSVSFLQMKQESPLSPVSHGTPAFRPKLHINLVCVCKQLTRSGWSLAIDQNRCEFTLFRKIVGNWKLGWSRQYCAHILSSFSQTFASTSFFSRRNR